MTMPPANQAAFMSDGRTYRVRIVPFEDGFCVHVLWGRYNVPMEREDALRRAERIAKDMGTGAYGIYDAAGQVIEVIEVS
jgi:hypothetical protein